MTPTIVCTAEVAASLWSGQRSLLILPYRQATVTMLDERRTLMVQEAYDIAPTGGTLYAADYPTSYGWKAAMSMTEDNARMWLSVVGRARLVYDRDITEASMIADGVYRVGCRFAWQRRAERIMEYETAAAAWNYSRRAAWGHTPAPGRLSKSVVIEVRVEKTLAGAGRVAG